MSLKCVLAAAGILVGCAAGDAPTATEDTLAQPSSNVPITPGNYTAGNVDIVSPFGAHIRDTYKYEAWRADATSPVRGHFHQLQACCWGPMRNCTASLDCLTRNRHSTRTTG